MRQHTKKTLDLIYKRLYSVILRYGSVKVIISCGGDNEYGQRLIKKSGKCTISYSGNYLYKKRYETSCFFDDYTEGYCVTCGKKRMSLAKTLKEMRIHDGTQYKIKFVYYGPRFNKVMRLK